MSTLFYLIGIIFFINEITVLRHPRKHLNWVRRVEKQNEKEDGYEKGKKIDFSSASKDEKRFIKFALYALTFVSWTFIGCLFSSQWLLFVGFVVFSFAVGFYRRRFYKNNTVKSIQVIKFDAFISSIWLAVIILNHFHNFVQL